MKEPRWLTEAEIHAIHDRQLAEHGGSAGIRDPGLLKSALDRPKNLFAYERPSLHEMAAAYAHGIAKNHPFVDGNKRTAFLAAYTFLGMNGQKLNASQEEVVRVVTELAAGKKSQTDLATWLHNRTVAKEKPQQQSDEHPKRKGNTHTHEF